MEYFVIKDVSRLSTEANAPFFQHQKTDTTFVSSVDIGSVNLLRFHFYLMFTLFLCISEPVSAKKDAEELRLPGQSLQQQRITQFKGATVHVEFSFYESVAAQSCTNLITKNRNYEVRSSGCRYMPAWGRIFQEILCWSCLLTAILLPAWTAQAPWNRKKQRHWRLKTPYCAFLPSTSWVLTELLKERIKSQISFTRINQGMHIEIKRLYTLQWYLYPLVGC